MSDTERETVYDGQLFRMELLEIDGRDRPYEFVKRVGAVSILPILTNQEVPQALVIHNTRRHYGASIGLPGGNIDGGFDDPESPVSTALRELLEETGYGYARPEARNLAVFRLRSISKTIEYPRYFAVLRGVEYLGGEDDNPHEVVRPQPTPLEPYAHALMSLERGELYPEVNAAFAKAAMELGREAVVSWLLGENEQQAAAVARSFEPWMTLVED